MVLAVSSDLGGRHALILLQTLAGKRRHGVWLLAGATCGCVAVQLTIAATEAAQLQWRETSTSRASDN